MCNVRRVRMTEAGNMGFSSTPTTVEIQTGYKGMASTHGTVPAEGPCLLCGEYVRLRNDCTHPGPRDKPVPKRGSARFERQKIEAALK
jgi:hypothetical protein